MKNILLKAKAVIEQGWCQGHYAMEGGVQTSIDSGSCFCMIGALSRVTGFNQLTISLQIPGLREFAIFLADKVQLSFDYNFATTESLLIMSNDSREMTKDKLVAWIDEYVSRPI